MRFLEAGLRTSLGQLGTWILDLDLALDLALDLEAGSQYTQIL